MLLVAGMNCVNDLRTQRRDLRPREATSNERLESDPIWEQYVGIPQTFLGVSRKGCRRERLLCLSWKELPDWPHCKGHMRL